MEVIALLDHVGQRAEVEARRPRRLCRVQRLQSRVERTLPNSHIPILDNGSTVLVKDVFLAEFAEGGLTVEHHASRLVQWTRCYPLRSVDVSA